MDNETVPDLPARPKTATNTPPAMDFTPELSNVNDQARILRQYEEQQVALQLQREADEKQQLELQRQHQLEFETRQREQAERERVAQEQLVHSQIQQYNNQAISRSAELEKEILSMKGQYDRDQLLLEQYDRV